MQTPDGVPAPTSSAYLRVVGVATRGGGLDACRGREEPIDASVVAFWRKYDINTRVPSHACCGPHCQITEAVDAADHLHEPVPVQRAVRSATLRGMCVERRLRRRRGLVITRSAVRVWRSRLVRSAA